MLDQALVSIIMPIYNAETYLATAINSVLNQSYQHLELLLINDGSDDGSAMICDDFAKVDRRVRVYHTINNGPGAARNFGISLANGEYIQFIDSDDFVERDMIKEMLASLQRNNADLAVCGMKRSFPKENLEELFFIPKKISYYHEIKKDFMHLLKQGLAYSSCNKLYKKSIIEKHNIRFDTEILHGEDAIFNIDYLFHCRKIKILDTPFYVYQQRQGSLINHYYEDKEKAQVLLFNKLNNYLSNHIHSDIKKELHAYYLMEFSYVIFQNCTSINSMSDFVNAIKNTRKFVKTPEFLNVLNHTYSYSWIQRLVLLLAKFKGVPLIVVIFYLYDRLRNRNYVGSFIELLALRELVTLGG
ncbi:glycosyltransferase family 2 protein [Bacillus sp. DNRA2]|uniref:glycosyltransferase family 2 protein n=1 Tax=Bacillus sp. DNRA2 TaxID=2723053 RepID=UPI00145EAC47|nr:glycosyltransferase family 2 protein [Bacillus sp. DNRA2]NMD70860.1 glycosyltransferase family 2 protein [Bacillus sp. DNRA2]